MKLTIALVVFIFHFSGVAAENVKPFAEEDDEMVSIRFKSRGRVESLIIKRSDVKDTPIWDPSSGNEPPVSLRDIPKIASLALRKLGKDEAIMRLNTIDLKYCGTTKIPNRWCYVIGCVQREDINAVLGTTRFAILMDGTIVLPVKEDK